MVRSPVYSYPWLTQVGEVKLETQSFASVCKPLCDYGGNVFRNTPPLLTMLAIFSVQPEMTLPNTTKR